MTLALLADRSRIARLRVHTARRDALQTSLRAGALVEKLDLSPPGLPRASILLIRELRDPLPGCVSFARAAEPAPMRWQQALGSGIARIAQAAERPALGPVSTSAAAVLFADEAELVACLLRDWLGGRVAERWWWRNVLGDLDPREWLRRHVLARGELLVPSMTILAARREAVACLARLDETESAMAIAAVERSHAVSLRSTEDAPMDEVRRGRAERRTTPVQALERLIAAIPEVKAAELRVPQRRLAALVLALVREPSWARTGELALAVRELERAAPSPGADLQRRSQELAQAVSPMAPASVRFEQPSEVAALHREQPVSEARGSTVFKEGHEESRPALSVQAETPAAVAPAPREEKQADPPALVAPEPQPGEARDLQPCVRVRTRFGGIFYLLNAALALKLYADFASPRGANLRVSPWDWLALIGREWFGRDFVRDPVWKLLAELSGRRGRRLRRPRGLGSQLEVLLTRLVLALGSDDGVPAFVCRHGAEVAATPSRVDVHFALSELPLALRIAGLDRDPGWIPAAGRSIAFHFE